MDSALILAMLDEIQNKDLGIHSVLIVRHGTLVIEVCRSKPHSPLSERAGF